MLFPPLIWGMNKSEAGGGRIYLASDVDGVAFLVAVRGVLLVCVVENQGYDGLGDPGVPELVDQLLEIVDSGLINPLEMRKRGNEGYNG